MTDTGKKMMLMGGSILIGLVIVEIVSSWIMHSFFYQPRIYAPSEYTSFTLLPDNKSYHHSREFRVLYEINDEGYRGQKVELPKPQGKKHILLLGDSFAFGHGVDEEEACSSQLEQIYRDQGRSDVEVINGGFMAGTAPDDAYSFLVSPKGKSFQADVVIEMVFLRNDPFDVEFHKWEKVNEKGLPIKVTAIYDGANRLHGRGEIPFYKAVPPFSWSGTVQLLARAYFAKVQLPARSKLIESRAIKYEEDHGGLSKNFLNSLAGMQDEVEKQKKVFVVGLIPTVDQITGKPSAFFDARLEELKNFLSERKIPFVVFDNASGFSPEDHYPLDSHWKPSGHSKAAKLLYELIKRETNSELSPKFL